MELLFLIRCPSPAHIHCWHCSSRIIWIHCELQQTIDVCFEISYSLDANIRYTWIFISYRSDNSSKQWFIPINRDNKRATSIFLWNIETYYTEKTSSLKITVFIPKLKTWEKVNRYSKIFCRVFCTIQGNLQTFCKTFHNSPTIITLIFGLWKLPSSAIKWGVRP